MALDLPASRVPTGDFPVTDPTRDARKLARRARRAAVIMAVSMMGWVAANFAGARLGWPAYLSFATDIAAICGLLWALWVTFEIWRDGRRNDVPPDD
ncbi:hypothetical protein HKCCE3408_17725 [Rhodobacterales bacterium HKCCE3408]|nr:hypothetical protein [Rhodobacterales bacterium HKCCE3408]